MDDKPHPIREKHEYGHTDCDLCAIIGKLPATNTQKDALRRCLIQEWVTHSQIVSDVCSYARPNLQPFIEKFADEIALRIRRPTPMISLVRDELDITDLKASELIQAALNQIIQTESGKLESTQSVVVPRPVWLFISGNGIEKIEDSTKDHHHSNLRMTAEQIVKSMGGLYSNTAAPEDIPSRLEEMLVDVIYISELNTDFAHIAAMQAREIIPWVGVVIEEQSPSGYSCIQARPRGSYIPVLDRKSFRYLSSEVHVRLPRFISAGPIPNLKPCDLIIRGAVDHLASEPKAEHE